jgi:hypothetical protein
MVPLLPSPSLGVADVALLGLVSYKAQKERVLAELGGQGQASQSGCQHENGDAPDVEPARIRRIILSIESAKTGEDPLRSK